MVVDAYNHESTEGSTVLSLIILVLHRKLHPSLSYIVAFSQNPKGWGHSSMAETCLEGLNPGFNSDNQKPNHHQQKTVSIIH